jgi:hypothetical protein
MLIEIADGELHFQVVSDRNETVDSGVILRRQDPTVKTSTS